MNFHFILLSVYLFFPEHGRSGVETDEVLVLVMEGDSVTLHTGIKKTQEDRIRWYFNETRIAQINGDPSKTCTDVQCNEGTERFRDRLKLDHQTGSLTITNTRTTDSGLYTLQISSSGHRRRRSISSVKSFDVTVINSGVSPAAVAGVCVVLLLASAAAAVIYHRHRRTFVQIPSSETS